MDDHPFVTPERLARWRADRALPAVPSCPACPTAPTVGATPLTCDRQNAIAAALAESREFRVLRRLTPRSEYEAAGDAPTHTALYIDVETTGKTFGNDHIIQLAIIPFTFTADGRVCEVRPSESWFEDPGVPISPEITRLTGICDADVRGQRLDDVRVQALLADAVLVIAHNAAFDRPFLERRVPGFAEVPWACSMAEVPWLDEGLPTMKLEWLAERHAGVFYDAHRADADCYAGIHLLASTLPSGRRAMAVLLERARQKTVRMWALASPFSTKDALKARGYRWSGGEDGQPKAWWRDVLEGEVSAEAAWLQEHIYGKGGKSCPAAVQRIGARRRYSHRVAAVPLHPVGLVPAGGGEAEGAAR